MVNYEVGLVHKGQDDVTQRKVVDFLRSWALGWRWNDV